MPERGCRRHDHRHRHVAVVEQGGGHVPRRHEAPAHREAHAQRHRYRRDRPRRRGRRCRRASRSSTRSWAWPSTPSAAARRHARPLWAGFSGPAVKPVALRMVWQCPQRGEGAASGHGRHLHTAPTPWSSCSPAPRPWPWAPRTSSNPPGNHRRHRRHRRVLRACMASKTSTN